MAQDNPFRFGGAPGREDDCRWRISRKIVPRHKQPHRQEPGLNPGREPMRHGNASHEILDENGTLYSDHRRQLVEKRPGGDHVADAALCDGRRECVRRCGVIEVDGDTPEQRERDVRHDAPHRWRKENANMTSPSLPVERRRDRPRRHQEFAVPERLPRRICHRRSAPVRARSADEGRNEGLAPGFQAVEIMRRKFRHRLPDVAAGCGRR